MIPSRHRFGLLLVLGVAAAAWAWMRRPETGLRLEKPGDSTFAAAADPGVRFDIAAPGAAEGQDRRYRLNERDRLRWTGYLYLPRTGNYRLELDSDDGSELFVGETRVVDNRGRHPRRSRAEEVFLERGWIPLRVEYENAGGGGYFDLRWRLPSGYHANSRIPRVYLRPEPPEPPAVLDRLLPAAAALCFLLAAVARWGNAARVRLVQALTEPGQRRTVALATLVFLVALGVRAGSVGAQGETCDEWAYVAAADIYVRNAVALELDADQWRTNREHPAVGKLIYGVVGAAFGGGPTPARVAAAILGALTVLIVFAVGRRLGGLGVAVPAGLVAALLPPVLAHSNIATLEAPLAFFYTASIAAFLRGLDDREPRPARWLATAWLSAGLAVATKFTAGLLLPFLYAGWFAWQGRATRRSGMLTMPWALYFGPLLGVLPVVLTWPWLWQDTLARLLDTFGHWKNDPGAELYLGDLLVDRPRSYFAVWFWAATPTAVTGAALVGIARALRANDRRWRFVVAWLVLPFLWSFVTLRQGGYRYVYPAFFPLALLAGAGIEAVGTALRVRAGAWIAAGALTVAVAVPAVRTAPYWHYSFNELVGGPSGVYRRGLFDVGFWAEGFDKAVDWLNHNAERDATVGLAGVVTHTAFGLRPDLRRCLEARSDCRGPRRYVIRDTIRAATEARPDYEEAFAVRVLEAPIAIVYRRTASATP